MTGLDFKNDLLVEIACVITNAQLELVAEGLNIVIQAPAERLEAMDPFVVNMHTESGLLPEICNVALSTLMQTRRVSPPVIPIGDM